MRLIGLSLLAALCLMPLPAQAQSFNCNYARTADEVLICSSAQLKEMDERMSYLYARTRNSLTRGARSQIEADQSRWLRGRLGCGRDAQCIFDAYRQRTRELEAACIAARAGCVM